VKKWFVLFFLISLPAFSVPNISFSAGAFMKNEKGMGQADEPRSGYSFAAGFRAFDWKFLAEYYQISQLVTGQETLAISSLAKGLLFSGQFLPRTKLIFDPYLTAGFGFEQRQVTTQFYGSQEQDNSRFYPQIFAGGGLRANFSQEFSLEGEGRLVFLENQLPNPAWLVLLKLSFDINL
jgi:hypothetical protein